jgi:hypothetical protein
MSAILRPDSNWVWTTSEKAFIKSQVNIEKIEPESNYCTNILGLILVSSLPLLSQFHSFLGLDLPGLLPLDAQSALDSVRSIPNSDSHRAYVTSSTLGLLNPLQRRGELQDRFESF